MSDEMRIQKFFSQAGICSRRQAEKHLLAGRISVNGKVVRELGTTINPARDRVEFDGKLVTRPDSFIYILLNKPANYITSLDDPEGRPVVSDLLPKNMPRIWPVGRLDWDSEGLLLLTNDGKLTNLLTHPSKEIPKVYAVKVRGRLTPEAEELKRLRKGVALDDGYVTRPAEVSLKRDNGRNSWVDVLIREGKNRQIRRMFDAIGFPVMKLRRIAIGPLTIEGLKSGTFRSLTHDEVLELYGEVEATIPERARPSARAIKRERQDADRHNRSRRKSRR